MAIQELYFYSVEKTLGANATEDLPISISADADFVVKRISISADDYSSKIRIIDTSSAREWFSKPIRLDHLAGNYGANSRPNSLFTPKRIPANNTLTITVQNTSSSPNTVSITLEGYREVK